MATGTFTAQAVLHELAVSRVFRWLDGHRWQALAVTLPFTLLVHLLMAAVTINRSNLDWHPSDQMAEVWLSRAARKDPVPLRTDGIRHPLWSWTVSKLHADDELVFFQRGKWLNTTFCMVFLAVLGVGVARWLDPLATANLLLLTSLGVLLVRGVYFQPEPLYYVFFLLASLLAVCVLRKAKAWHFAALGVACGLAFLAKPSFEPFLLAFGATFAFRAGLSLFCDRKNWPPLKNSLLLATGLVLMALIVLPLGRYSKEAYGKVFFGYPKFWMWMDDFRTEAYPFAATNWSRAHLEKLGPGDLPSAAWYFRRHTVRDAATRLWNGTREVVARFFYPEQKLVWHAFFWRPDKARWRQPLAHRGVYLLALAALCVVLLWPVRQTVLRRLLEPGNLAAATFVLMVAMLYTLLYGWYLPIGKGDRFMGGLWIPAVFLLCWLASLLRATAGAKGTDSLYLGVHCAILLSLLLQSACILWRFHQGGFLKTQN
jgi:hypothetical protein